MTFAIFEDLVPNTSAVKIHLKRCHHYVDHEFTKTTKWHEVGDYETAKTLAELIAKNNKKGWRDAKCCQ